MLSASAKRLRAVLDRRKETLLLIAYTTVLATFYYIEAYGLDGVRIRLERRFPKQMASRHLTREEINRRSKILSSSGR